MSNMKIFTLFLSCIFATHLFAANSVLHFCVKTSKEQAFAYAEKKGIQPLLYMAYENALVVQNNTHYTDNQICFISEWREKSPHFAYAKNEIIVRVAAGKLADFYSFTNRHQFYVITEHPFIPHQFTIKNVAHSEESLIFTEQFVKNQPFVKAAQINYVHSLSATSVNDPLFNRQWAIKNTGTSVHGNGTVGADMNVDSAWQITTGNTNLKIAILDSGVDTLHEDLSANMLAGFDGFADEDNDTRGYPTPNFSSDSHGTACAGIAAAVGNNNLGVAGVAYSSKIVPVRIFYYQDYGGSIGVQATTNTDALTSGSAYAWRVADADIMSTSAGLSPIFIFFLNISTDVVNDEIRDAYNEGRAGKGVPMFFSAGNDDIDDVLWPAYLYQTIAVGASSMCDERKSPDDCSTESWGSTFGTHLDIVAPGTLIATTDLTGTAGYSNNNYTFSFNGTSAACPNAAGVGALILSVRPDLHARDVKSILNKTAKKVDGYDFDTLLVDGTWNQEVGYGRVDAYKALQLAQTYQSTVSVSKLERNTFVSIFPNPSQGTINIVNDNSENIKLSVFTVDGKLVTSNIITSETTYTESFSSGIYFLRLTDSRGNLQVEKVIVY